MIKREGGRRRLKGVEKEVKMSDNKVGRICVLIPESDFHSIKSAFILYTMPSCMVCYIMVCYGS